MKNFVVRISDGAHVDTESRPVVVQAESVAQAVQLALEDMEDATGGFFEFPLFIDIHPAKSFEHVEWMYDQPVNR